MSKNKLLSLTQINKTKNDPASLQTSQFIIKATPPQLSQNHPVVTHLCSWLCLGVGFGVVFFTLCLSLLHFTDFLLAVNKTDMVY